MLSSVPRDSPVSIQLCECSQELKPDSKNQKALYASVYTFQLFCFHYKNEGVCHTIPTIPLVVGKTCGLCLPTSGRG